MALIKKPVSHNVTHKFLIVVEGDITLTELLNNKPGQRTFLFDENRIWTDGKYKYKFFNIVEFHAN